MRLLGTWLLVASSWAMAADVQDIVGPQAIDALRDKVVLLAGATGNNGSVIREQLAELGLEFRAMTRDAAGARKKFGADYDWVEADVTEPASLVDVVTGVDVVIWAVATARPFGGNRPEMVDYQGAVNLATAASKAGATRMVMITSAVAGKEDHFLNWFGDMLIWKKKGEEAVMASGLEYVIVGPAGIDFEPGGTRPIRLQPRADYAMGQRIVMGDLAAVIIAAAGLPEAANRVFVVSNGDGDVDLQWQQQFAAMPAR